MSDIEDEIRKRIEDGERKHVSMPLPPTSKEGPLTPSSNAVKVIKRNRRGPMMRPSSLNPTKYLSSRGYKDHTDSRRINNLTNRDHESLIESLLRQPLDTRPHSRGNSTFSHKTDRYGPPFVEEEVLERYEAPPISPSVILTFPFVSNGKKNVTFFRALVLLLTLSIVIIVVIVLRRFTFTNDMLSYGNLRSHGQAASKMTYRNNTDPLRTEEHVVDDMANLEQRSWLISKDTTMDIGFATDDMIVDQSQINDMKGEGIEDQNDDASDILNNGNNTEIDEKEKNDIAKGSLTTSQSKDTEKTKKNL